MGRISILIASRDSGYNEALAAAFLDINKSISVTAVSFKSLERGDGIKPENYDVVLADEMPKGAESFKDKITILLDNRVKSEDLGQGFVYKYQKAEDILARLIDNGLDVRNSEKSIEYQKPNAISVGVLYTSETESCGCFGLVLAKAVAFTGRSTVYLDLREFQKDEGIHVKNAGKRSWDDLIFCCVYGKNNEVLSDPGKFASEEESGLMYFKSSLGRNPYWELERNEREKFQCKLKENLNSEIYISVIKEDSIPRILEASAYYDVLIFVTSGGLPESDKELTEALVNHKPFKGELINICSGSRFNGESNCDFIVFFPEDTWLFGIEKLRSTRTWKDVDRIARYIGRNFIL